jgi:DNA-binding transcriptional LysR family regulator
MPNRNSDRFVRTHVKTRHLVLLVEMDRHRSILHAAKAANLTQPAASKQLAELEYALGVQLFERVPRGVIPTRYGEVLIRRAGAALAELDAAHQEVMELLSGLSGKVAVGSVLTPSVGLLPDAINCLKARHGKIQVSVVVDTCKKLVERLRAGEIDIAIGRILDTKSAAELNFEPLIDEPHRLVVRAGHPLVGRHDLRLDELAQACWIVPPAGSKLRDRLTSLFLSHGLDQPADVVETVELPLITRLLVGSDMIAAMSEETVRMYLESGTLTVLHYDLHLRMDEYGIVTRRQHELAPAAKALLDILRESLAGTGRAKLATPAAGECAGTLTWESLRVGNAAPIATATGNGDALSPPSPAAPLIEQALGLSS